MSSYFQKHKLMNLYLIHSFFQSLSDGLKRSKCEGEDFFFIKENISSKLVNIYCFSEENEVIAIKVSLPYIRSKVTTNRCSY